VGLPVEAGVRCRPRRPHPLGRPAWGGVPVTAATRRTAACEAFRVGWGPGWPGALLASPDLSRMFRVCDG
jgi:hypothetical protein